MSKFKPSLLLRLRQWYLNKFVPYITIQQNNEHVFISPKLWQLILKDVPEGERNNLKVWFKTYPDEKGRMQYEMIINPNFKEEFTEDVYEQMEDAIEDQKRFERLIKDKPRSVQIIESIKRMKKLNSTNHMAAPFTAPIQFNIYGHIGFQSVQPGPTWLVYDLNLDKAISRKFGRILELTDRIPLRVVPTEHGRIHSYIITDDVLHRPTPTFAVPFEDRKRQLAQQRHARQRIAANMARRK